MLGSDLPALLRLGAGLQAKGGPRCGITWLDGDARDHRPPSPDLRILLAVCHRRDRLRAGLDLHLATQPRFGPISTPNIHGGVACASEYWWWTTIR
jgi:hypothetical protein